MISCAYCASVDSTTGSCAPCCAAISRQIRKSLACSRTRKPAGKLIVRHERRAIDEVPARARALAQELDQPIERQALGVRKGHRLADGLDDARTHDLIGGLRRLAGAARAEVGDGFPHAPPRSAARAGIPVHRRPP